MSNCPMCEGVGKIPQRGSETSGAREVCPTCNGVGTVPEGTQETHVYNAPDQTQPDAGGAVDQGNVDPAIPTEDAPKAEGADSTDSSSGSESGAPEKEANGPTE